MTPTVQDQQAALKAFERAFRLHTLGHYGAALAEYQSAHNSAPGWHLPLYHAAVSLHHLRRYALAIACYQQAILRRPDEAMLRYHHAKALKDSGQLDAAVDEYKAAVALDPNNADIRYSQGLLYLMRGEWEAGWVGYELRWEGSDRANSEHRPVTRLPRWHGESVTADSGIIIYAEQGMGDSLMGYRYAAMLRARFDRVCFSVQAPLLELFQGNAPDGVEIVARVAEPLDETGYTHQSPLMSLPVLFGTMPDTVPNCPYLRANEAQAAHWKLRLGPETRSKIGLVWQGGKLSYAPARDISWSVVSALLERRDVAWVSLQKDEAPPSDAPILHWMDDCRGFNDTAALIASLDLVVTVDTAVAHLAGALGKPVWLLNRFESEWRWMQGKATTPWYPTMRIFREPKPNDWASVITAVGHALSEARRPDKP